MSAIKYQIAGRTYPTSWRRSNFMQKTGEPKGLVNIPLRICVRAKGIGFKELDRN